MMSNLEIVKHLVESIRLSQFLSTLSNLKRFHNDFWKYKTLRNQDDPLELKLKDLRPLLWDRDGCSGFDKHYFYHLAWAARLLANSLPDIHVDFSSSLNFCAIISAFTNVRFYDYVPINIHLENVEMGVADLTALSFDDNIFTSMSCMHVVEHIGLGRYGDTIDPDGDKKAMRELQRVLAPKGQLLFVVPVGRPRIVFNAHRIYSYEQILASFPKLTINEFSLIPDNADERGLIRNAPMELVKEQNYACGCFLFQKDDE